MELITVAVEATLHVTTSQLLLELTTVAISGTPDSISSQLIQITVAVEATLHFLHPINYRS